MPITSGPTPATAHDRSASSGRRPRRSASSRVVTTHIAAPSFWPLALPAVTVDSASTFSRTGRSLARSSRVVSGRGCSSRSTTTSGLPRRPGTVTGHQLVGEPAGLVGGPGALLGADGELVLLLAADGVLPAEVLRGLEHPAGDRVVPAAGGDPGPVEPVHQLDAAGADAGAQPERVVLDLRHRLGPAGDDHPRGAGRDLAGGVQHGLQAGAAAPVELEPGDAGAEAGVEGGDPADRRGLAVGVALAEHDVVDVALAEPGPADQLGQGQGGEVHGAQRGQGPAEAPHGRADRFADHDVGHGSTVGAISDMEKYPFRHD